MKLVLPKPYISSSQITTWHYNKGQYVDRYIFNVPIIETPELLFGKKVSDLMESGKWGNQKKVVRDALDRLIRYTHPEFELKATIKTKKGEVDLLGYIDSFSPIGFYPRNKKPLILEYKTGGKVWDKKRADEHFQTQLYAGIVYKQTGIIPEVKLQWIQTHRVNGVCEPTGVVRTFRVNVTVASMLGALNEAAKVAVEIHDWFEDYRTGAQRAMETADTPIPDWMK